MKDKITPTPSTNPYVDIYNKGLERQKKNTYKAPAPYIPGRLRTWVFGFTLLDKPVLWGPYATDQEAEVNAVELDRYELFHLNTIDTAKASRMVKHELISRGESPDEAMSKLMHKHTAKTIERKARKWY